MTNDSTFETYFTHDTHPAEALLYRPPTTAALLEDKTHKMGRIHAIRIRTEIGKREAKQVHKDEAATYSPVTVLELPPLTSEYLNPHADNQS